MTITNFLAVDGAPEETNFEAKAVREPPRIAESQQLYLVVLVDSLNLRPQDRARVFRNLREVLGRGLGPKEQVLVVSHARSLDIRQPFTSDLQLVTDALNELEMESGHGLQRDSERRQMMQLIEEATAAEGVRERLYQYAEWELTEARASLEALEQIVSSLGGIKGRKVVIYVGDGIPMVAAEDLFNALTAKFGDSRHMLAMQGYRSDAWVEELARQANASQVTLYALDAAGTRPPATSSVLETSPDTNLPVGLIDSTRVTNTQSTLQFLADSTGGSAVLNANDVGPGLDRMVRDLETYYSLGYQPAAWGTGEFHEIRVKVARKGLRIRHRSGYLDKPVTARRSDRTRSSLLYGHTSNPLKVGLRLGEVENSAESSFVGSVELTIPLNMIVLLPQAETHEGRLRVYYGAMDWEGNLSEIHQETVPVMIPSAEIDHALQSSFRFRRPLRLQTGPESIAVGVWDEIGGSGSLLQGRVDP